MPKLVLPTRDVHASFLLTLDEYHDDPNFLRDAAHYLRRASSTFDLASSEGFAAYVTSVLDEKSDDDFTGDGRVPNTILWFVDGSEFLGRLSIRHRLNDWLRTYGGHIGYEVRPSARRQGYATEMLRQALPHAHRLGVDPALVTCDHDNDPSRKVIEANGGIYENRQGPKLRYWLPTTP